MPRVLVDVSVDREASPVDRLCAAAESAIAAGRLDEAAGLLAQALRDAVDPFERADVQVLRGRLAVLAGSGRDAAAELRRAADDVLPQDPARAAGLLIEATIAMLYGAQRVEALPVALRAAELADAADAATRARARVVRGLAHLFANDLPTARPYLADCGEVMRVGGAPQEAAQLLQYVVVGLAGLERYEDALAVCQRFVASARAVSAAGVLPIGLCLLANTAYFTSDYDTVELAASEALQLAVVGDQPSMGVYARTCLALAHAVRGEADQTREHAEHALSLVRTVGMETFRPTLLIALALLELGAGRWAAAADCFARVDAALADVPTVPGTLHWRADRIEAVLRAGDCARARQLVAELSGVVAEDGPWERAAAARCAALLADDGPTADALFAEAMALHAQSPSVLERARTELCWAERLLCRDPVQAEQLLLRCRADFDRLGARDWAARAAALLERAGSAVPAERAPAGADDRVLVRALGPLTIVRDGAPSHVGMDAPGRALRYVVAAGGAVARDELIEALWPEEAADVGPARLRTVLARVRRQHGAVLVREGSVVRWADNVEVDADRFVELARRALAAPEDPHAVEWATEAVRIYTGDLLPMARYQDWAIGARERLRHRHLDLLDLLGARTRQRGDLDAAAGHLRAALELEPCDEARYVRLITVLIEAGKWGAARDALRRAEAMLGDLGLPPSGELRELRCRLAGAPPD